MLAKTVTFIVGLSGTRQFTVGRRITERHGGNYVDNPIGSMLPFSLIEWEAFARLSRTDWPARAKAASKWHFAEIFTPNPNWPTVSLKSGAD
jgi:hypothetical protein